MVGVCASCWLGEVDLVGACLNPPESLAFWCVCSMISFTVAGSNNRYTSNNTATARPGRVPTRDVFEHINRRGETLPGEPVDRVYIEGRIGSHAKTQTGARHTVPGLFLTLVPFRVACAQLNPAVGNVEENTRRAIRAVEWAEQRNADLVVLPELMISGYPPEDLVLDPGFLEANRRALTRLARAAGRATTVAGFPDASPPPSGAAKTDDHPGRIFNAAAVMTRGRVVGTYHKRLLPNYGVFDERRWFRPGQGPVPVWPVGNVKAGLSICEDLWTDDGPWRGVAAAGADVLVNINASPYHMGKPAEREALTRRRARQAGLPVVYVNLVGGQDSLVFDGASLVTGSDGTVVHRGAQFTEERFVVDVPLRGEPTSSSKREWLGPEEELWQAITLSTRDYFQKNGFESAIVGLSGGIDSAVTACVAADALGSDRVWGVAMPSMYSSEHSKTDAKLLAANLGIRFDMVSIERIHNAFADTLSPVMGDGAWGVAGENLQARARGSLLMALSNRHGGLVLATGNKSELAVGYATLYGDMAGGFAPLQDVYKTWVYRLARWKNRYKAVIPEGTIDKAPSAELRPGQVDADSLPPYDILDAVLEMHVTHGMPAGEITDAGYDQQLVRKATRMVKRSEYKRRQGAPGPKVTTEHFGRDRRYPITNGWDSE